ncbi:MAG TPA: transcription-repair coupling factor, partial [Burkholderiales bacterium]
MTDIATASLSGHRPAVAPKLAGSADALALARLAAASRPLVVFTADAGEAQRLRDEIPWFAPELQVALLPDWETLPYDSFSPHHDLVSERLATLYRITRGEFDVAIVPATTALYRMGPPAYLAAYSFFVKKGDRLAVQPLRSQLVTAGYTHVTQVVAPGEYCVRGGLIDLFPMGSALPFRIDLADDEIESIRTFDPDTQRTVYQVPEIRLLPAREFPMDDAGRTRFRAHFRETFEGDPSKSSIYKDVSNGIAPAGIEYFLPLFFDQSATLFDYLPEGTRLWLPPDLHEAFTRFGRDTQSRYQVLKGDRTRPVLPPSDLFLSAENFFAEAKRFARAETPDVRAEPLPDLAVERRAADPLHRLKDFLAGFSGRTLVLAESPGRRETITQ